jgi:peptidoglycan glycosyltransferase
MTWGDVLALACPHPVEELAGRWDTDGLAELFEAYGLTQPPGLPINTQNTPPSPAPEDAARAAIGQENLTVSPLQLALAFGMMVNNGRLPAAQLVEAVETESESWESVPVATQPGMSQLVEPEVAHQVWQGLARDMAGNASPIAEHAVSVLAGPEGTTNSWYAGLTAGDSPTHYVLLLVLEGETGPDTATQIGRRVLEMTR